MGAGPQNRRRPLQSRLARSAVHLSKGARDPRFRAIESVARSLVAEADAHHVALQEFQLDYDCAQRNLGAYRAWLQQLRSAIQPARFVITALPSWLDEPEFATLARGVDGYVLQVHSVPLGGARGGALCDPQRGAM
ncbi:MAG: DUF3142 domain-containing protein, partial [Bryobacteraceae bacterium]